MAREFLEVGQFNTVARAAFGRGRSPVSVTRMPGGTTKGVYRLAFGDGGTAVAYVWAPTENYWPTTDPWDEGTDIARFEAAYQRFDAIGVRTPRVHLLDASRSRFPSDVAIVEDVGDTTLEALLDRDPTAARPALTMLGAALEAMRHGVTHDGSHGGPDADDRPGRRACEQVVLDRAVGHLDEAAGRVPRIGAVRDRLAAALDDLAGAVPPRTRHGLVHGELGPDHVLVDRAGNPALIDIEGTMVFDVEWEHAFLRLRFGPHYRWLRVTGLDEARLRFYSLALHLSLVAGPLRLLDGDFPGRDRMLAIAAANTDRVLSHVDGHPLARGSGERC